MKKLMIKIKFLFKEKPTTEEIEFEKLRQKSIYPTKHGYAFSPEKCLSKKELAKYKSLWIKMELRS